MIDETAAESASMGQNQPIHAGFWPLLGFYALKACVFRDVP